MKRVLNSPVAEAVLLILAGLILVFFPNGTLYLVCRILGIGLLILAAVKIYTFASGKNGRQPVDLVIGIILGIIALILMGRPSFFTNIAPICAGILIGAGGVFSLIKAMSLKKQGGKAFPAFVGAILTLGFALLVLIRPSIITGIFVSIIGIALVVEGVSMLLTEIRK